MKATIIFLVAVLGACATVPPVPVWSALDPATQAKTPTGLVNAANAYVSALIAHDWDTAYSMLGRSFTTGIKAVNNSQIFTTVQGASVLLQRFELQSVQVDTALYTAHGESRIPATIDGCAVLSGFPNPVRVFVNAQRAEGRWLFDFIEVAHRIGQPAEECRFRVRPTGSRFAQ